MLTAALIRGSCHQSDGGIISNPSPAPSARACAKPPRSPPGYPCGRRSRSSMSDVQATTRRRARSESVRFIRRGYDFDRTPLKRTCDVCRKMPRVHKSGRNEVHMRSTIVAVLSLFMATTVLAQTPAASETAAQPVKPAVSQLPKPPWEPEGAPIVPDDGGPPRVYFAHSYDKDTPNVAGLDDRI